MSHLSLVGCRVFLCLAEDPDPLVGPLRLQAPQQQRPTALLHVQTGVEDTANETRKFNFDNTMDSV